MAAVELRNLEQLAQSTAGRIAQLLGDSRNLADYVGTDDDFVAFLAEADHGPASRPRSPSSQGLIKSNPDVQFTMVMNAAGDALVASDPRGDGQELQVPRVLQGRDGGPAAS